MRRYDPALPLFSLHVPKCGGQSLRRILEQWFGDLFRVHYFQQYNALPPRHEVRAGMCIHGHFNHTRGFGVKTYYPAASQFITVLRDPLEAAVSNYFFWKKRHPGADRGGGEDAYRDIDDFFRKRPQSHLGNFLPEDMNEANFRDYLQSRFVWVGIVDDLQRDVGVLTQRLGFHDTVLEHINQSPRDENLSADLAAEFRESNRWLFELVDFARTFNSAGKTQSA